MSIRTRLASFIEKRASLENPSTSLSNPAAWLVDWATGGKSSAGVNVNNENALKLSPVWACVRVLSEDIGSLPLNVYKREEKGKSKASDHPVHRLLHDRPNPEMTAMAFRETITAHILTWGNGYAEIERNGAGKPVALWPITPNRVEVGRNLAKQKVYKVKVDGKEVVISSENILHIPGLGFDGLTGYSPIGMARQAIGLGLAAEEYGAQFFGNGSKPGGILKRAAGSPNLSKEAKARLKESWEAAHQGLSNAQRVAVLEEGMEWQQIGIAPEDAQFLDTRKFQVIEIARMFRVPPHMIGALENATFSNIESQSLEYVTRTLRPWLVRWEQNLNYDLFSESERPKFFAEHVIDGLLRGDSASRIAYYQGMFNMGAFSPNDILELENKNAVEGGDQRFVQLNLVPLDKAADFAENLLKQKSAGASTDPNNMPPADTKQETKKLDLSAARERLIADVKSRMVTRELIQARKALKKGSEHFRTWLGEFYSEHESTVYRAFLPVIQAMEEAGDEYAGSADSYARNLAALHKAEAVRSLEKALESDKPEAVLAGVLDAWEARFTTNQEKAA